MALASGVAHLSPMQRPALLDELPLMPDRRAVVDAEVEHPVELRIVFEQGGRRRDRGVHEEVLRAEAPFLRETVDHFHPGGQSQLSAGTQNVRQVRYDCSCQPGQIADRRC